MARTTVVAAPGPPYFALHTLGWRAFQDLCAAVLRHVWGQSVQAFADSNDAGRDGAFYGDWEVPSGSQPGSLPRGPFVLQCKHTKSPDATLSASMLNDEFAKVRGLVERGLCNSYILLTNARVTGSTEDRVRSRLADAGVTHPLVLGGQWICDTIASHRNLRMFVPRVYGLGDLSQILDERSYAQAASLLAGASGQVSTFVATKAYRKAADALRNHGFALLLGEPGVGKSAIALMLALGAADNWGSLLIKARNSRDLLEHWNPQEKDQLFWVDDAFGTVRHEERMSLDWSRDLPLVMSAIKGGARVVLTSRTYIYREARAYLKSYAYPLLEEGLVTVDVTDVSYPERQQMLYNHLVAGDQPDEVRELMTPHLELAAQVDPFIPEAARRLGLQAFTRHLKVDRESIVSFVAKPENFLADVYDQLDASGQSALALVYSAGSYSGLTTCSSFDSGDRHIVEVVGSTVGEAEKALHALTGTFLQQEKDPLGGVCWRFKHPTLREGFARWLQNRHRLTAAILRGMDDDTLLSSTDCLPPDAEPVLGTLMRVPSPLYGAVAKRFFGFFLEWPEGSCWTGDTLRYLARRASDEMLAEYIVTDPDLPSRLIEFESFASFVPEPLLLGRLHRMGLLSEKHRRQACNRMARLAVRYLDPAWLDDGPWRTLLTAEERKKFLSYVRKHLVPVVTKAVEEGWADDAFWRSDRDFNDQDEANLVEYALRLYRQAFAEVGDKEAVEAFTKAMSTVPESASPTRKGSTGETVIGDPGPNTGLGTELSLRSVFDDIGRSC